MKSTTHRCSHLTIRAGRTTTGVLHTFSCNAVVNIFIRAGLRIAYDFLIFRTWCKVLVRFWHTEQVHNVVSDKTIKEMEKTRKNAQSVKDSSTAQRVAKKVNERFSIQ